MCISFYDTVYDHKGMLADIPDYVEDIGSDGHVLTVIINNNDKKERSPLFFKKIRIRTPISKVNIKPTLNNIIIFLIQKCHNHNYNCN